MTLEQDQARARAKAKAAAKAKAQPDPRYQNLDAGGFAGAVDTTRKAMDDAQRYMIDNITWGLMDPAVGWASDKINSLTGAGQQEGGVARERGRTEQATKDLPMAAKVPLTLASGVVSPTASEALLAKGAGYFRRALAETIEGGAQGALSAAGHGGDAEDIKSGGIWGGGLGSLGGLVSGAFRKGEDTWANWTGGSTKVEKEAAKLADEADRAYIAKADELDKKTKINKDVHRNAEKIKEIRQRQIREDFSPLDAERQREIANTKNVNKLRGGRKTITNPDWEQDEMLARLATQVNPRKVATEKFGNTLQGGGGIGKFNLVPMLGGNMAGSWIKGRSAALSKYDPALVEAAKASLRGPSGPSDLMDRDGLARLLSRISMATAR